MELSEIYPSLNEFLDQVNIVNFDQKELDFSKEIILKTDFKSWENYVANRYHLFSNTIDIEGFINEMTSFENDQLILSGNLKLILNKHINYPLIAESNKWCKLLSKLTNKKAKQFEDFEVKLYNLLVRMAINKNKNVPEVIETLNAFLKDAENQNNIIKSIDLSATLNPQAYTESISLSNLNKVIENKDSKHFYFPNKAPCLKNLHDALVEHKLIETNPDFEKLFETEFNFKNKLKPIVWTFQKPITQLLYLLYKLNDNGNDHKGYSIAKIAFDLFKLKDTTTENSLKVNLNQVLYRFEDPHYIKRNMKLMDVILNSLES